MKLTLTLKRQWFDLIADGVKKEEYREIKPYWIKRLNHSYKTIEFRNGYSNDSPTIELEYLGYSKQIVNFPIDNITKEVFVLKLGEILKIKNYTNPKNEFFSVKIRFNSQTVA